MPIIKKVYASDANKSIIPFYDEKNKTYDKKRFNRIVTRLKHTLPSDQTSLKSLSDKYTMKSDIEDSNNFFTKFEEALEAMLINDFKNEFRNECFQSKFSFSVYTIYNNFKFSQGSHFILPKQQFSDFITAFKKCLLDLDAEIYSSDDYTNLLKERRDLLEKANLSITNCTSETITLTKSELTKFFQAFRQSRITCTYEIATCIFKELYMNFSQIIYLPEKVTQSWLAIFLSYFEIKEEMRISFLSKFFLQYTFYALDIFSIDYFDAHKGYDNFRLFEEKPNVLNFVDVTSRDYKALVNNVEKFTKEYKEKGISIESLAREKDFDDSFISRLPRMDKPSRITKKNVKDLERAFDTSIHYLLSLTKEPYERIYFINPDYNYQKFIEKTYNDIESGTNSINEMCHIMSKPVSFFDDARAIYFKNELKKGLSFQAFTTLAIIVNSLRKTPSNHNLIIPYSLKNDTESEIERIGSIDQDKLDLILKFSKIITSEDESSFFALETMTNAYYEKLK